MASASSLRRPLAIAGALALAGLAFAFAGTQQVRSTSPSASTAQVDSARTSAPAVFATYDDIAFAGAQSIAALLTPSEAGADPFFVEPRVPRAAGTPCVIELARSMEFREFAPENGFAWTPPTDCPGPYAKAKLIVEMSGPRPPGAGSVGLRLGLYRMDFGGQAPFPGVIFMGSPQEHDLVPLWHLERDVTELASIFDRPMFLYAISENNVPDSSTAPSSVVARSVKLVLYPASDRTPAQRPADLVLNPCEASAGCGGNLMPVMPRNIERAFLDVYARIDEGWGRFWYSCLREEDFQQFPQFASVFAMGDAPSTTPPYAAQNGCNGFQGGSWRVMEVTIDGIRVGYAPFFPWLPSDVHYRFPDTIDYPAPSVQALNVVPYRVDLTPFAALLSDGRQHFLGLRQLPNGGAIVVQGQLLLYLDHGSTQVTGAVTRNDVADDTPLPTFEGGFSESGGTTSGQLRTRNELAYVIEGYVDTSRGRITTRLTERHLFANTQTLAVVGQAWWLMPVGTTAPGSYLQRVRLSSTVDRVSHRTLGGAVLTDDRDYISYPLILDYLHAGTQTNLDGTGPTMTSSRLDVTAHQARAIRASHFRPSIPRYDTRLVDVFDGSVSWRATGKPQRTNWDSQRRYLFTDTFGSCYSAGLTTANGILQTRTRGAECPNGNGIRWFAHPDGSPDALGWVAE